MYSTDIEKEISPAEYLEQQLDRELISKIISATPGTILCAAWVAYTKAESIIYADLIFYLSLIMLVMQVSRYLIVFCKKKFQIKYVDFVLFFKFNILTVGLLWSAIILIPLVEFKLINNTVSALQIMSLIVALSMSSIATQAYRLKFAYFFQFIILMPPMIYFVILYLTEKNIAALNGFVILFIVIVYSLKQTLEVNKQFVLRVRNTIAMELSNKLLTESKDQLIQESAKLQQVTKLAILGEISGEIAHEINNPLTIIQGNIDLILSSFETGHLNTEIIKNKLQKSLTAISRITKIIAGLKNFSRSTENTPFIRIEICELINEALDFTTEKITFNKVKINFNSLQKFHTRGRPVELAQVLLNILSNGIDALTKISTEMRQINIFVSSFNDTVTIKISNSGEKLKPEIASKLFESYFSTKENRKGMGLGLSISKRIIDSHLGKLYYDAHAANTTFIIELPLEI